MSGEGPSESRILEEIPQASEFDMVIAPVASLEIGQKVKNSLEQAKEIFAQERVLREMRNMSKILAHSNPLIEIGLTVGNGDSRPYAVWRIEPRMVPVTSEPSPYGRLWTSRGVMVQLEKDQDQMRIYYSAGKEKAGQGDIEIPDGTSQQDLLRIAHEAGYRLKPAGMDMINPSKVNYRWRELHPGQTFKEFAQSPENQGRNITLANELVQAFRKSSHLHDGRKGDDVSHLEGSQFGNSIAAYQRIQIK